MSAAEKLRALHSEGRPAGASWTESFCADIFDALPQIVAVVEAAERLLAAQPIDLPAHSLVARNQRDALTALDRALP